MRRAFALGVAVLLAAVPVVAGASAPKGKTKLTGVVNLNTATAAQLDLLPGVGEKAAKDIIAFRLKQPFKRIEDIVKVRGFGKKRFEKMKAHLAVIGNTTIRAERPGGDPARGRAGRRGR